MTQRSTLSAGEKSSARDLAAGELAPDSRADSGPEEALHTEQGCGPAAAATTTATSIALVLKGYPRLSETFIAQEIHALERAGLQLRLVSLRHPTDAHVHPIHAEICAPVSYLPEYVVQEPLRVLRAWRCARRLPGYDDAWRTFVRDLWRDRTVNRIRRFAQALVLAHELEADVSWLHAHFLHTPASVTRYAALIRRLPWSASAHARDIWTSPPWEKREKLNDAQFTVTCTRHNVEHLRALTTRPDSVSLVYHGLDLARFAAPPSKETAPHGEDALRQQSSQGPGALPGPVPSPVPSPVRVLSVGRAVQKKGYSTLLEALALLPPNCSWRFDHVGGGPLLKDLREQAEALGIAQHIHWHGAQPQDQVLAHYRQAEVFALASVIAADGDRDGLPNVLMEAQSQGLACVATDISAVSELIDNETTGLLVAAGDAQQLAHALERVINDPGLRNELARAGEARVRQFFDIHSGIELLRQQFEPALAAQAEPR
jgi:glycosyltransferase involved in cell wall biosynthesis